MEVKAIIGKWKPKVAAFFHIPVEEYALLLLFLLLAFIFWLMLFFQKENVKAPIAFH